MTGAEQPKPEAYREIAEKLRELADQSYLPDIQEDLRALAARFERMAAYYQAQRRQGAARRTGKE
jgi:glutathione synthase/RimK-type ligase-like ATP-grasp enzyme